MLKAASVASFVSMKQISLKPGDRLIALALTAKKQCLPIGLERLPNPNEQSSTNIDPNCDSATV